MTSELADLRTHNSPRPPTPIEVMFYSDMPEDTKENREFGDWFQWASVWTIEKFLLEPRTWDEILAKFGYNPYALGWVRDHGNGSGIEQDKQGRYYLP